jgi:hypothetical protein
MRLDLDLLKNHLNRFTDECELSPEKIGTLANESSSVDDFKNKLDELCRDKTGKSSLEILAGIGVRLPATENSQKPSNPSENTPLQNELVEVQKKIDNLNERDKSR